MGVRVGRQDFPATLPHHHEFSHRLAYAAKATGDHLEKAAENEQIRQQRKSQLKTATKTQEALQAKGVKEAEHFLINFKTKSKDLKLTTPTPHAYLGTEMPRKSDRKLK